METSKIEVCPRHKGHMWTLTNMKLHKTTSPGKHDTGGAFIYETIDGGQTWQVIYSGVTNGSIQWFDLDPADPDMLWVIWSRAISRMRRPAFARVDVVKGLDPPDDPPLGEMVAAAYNYTGASPGLLLNYRRRSLIKALVPRVDAQFVYYRLRDYPLLHDGLYRIPPFRRDSTITGSYKDFRLLVTWDLSDVIFSLNTVMFGRVSRVCSDLRGWVLRDVQHFYGEFRRLRQLMAVYPPKELRVRLMYRLRIEELSSYLNFLSGNYLAR